MKKKKEIETRKLHVEAFEKGRFVVRYKVSDMGVLKYTINPVFVTPAGVRFVPKDLTFGWYAVDRSHDGNENVSFRSVIHSIKTCNYRYKDGEYQERDLSLGHEKCIKTKMFVEIVDHNFVVTIKKPNGDVRVEKYGVNSDKLIRLG